MNRRLIFALYPFSLALAAALITKGYASIGDGFSAGAVAGLGAALQYLGLDHASAHARIGAAWALRLILLGLLAALGLLLLPALFGIAPVTHYPTPEQSVLKLGMLELHTALVFDLAIAAVVYGTLVVTFDQLFTPTTRDLP